MQLSNMSKQKLSNSQDTNQNKPCMGEKHLTANGDVSVPGTIMAMNNAVLNCTISNNLHGKFNAEMEDDESMDDLVDEVRLTFNVCGEKFEILESTVGRYPNTLLGDPQKRQKLWSRKHNEYFLDRNRACFESVITYYQSYGILIRPSHIPDVLFQRELKFYELGEEVIQRIKRDEDGNDENESEKPVPDNKFQKKIWDLFEHPETSNAARYIAWLSCGVVLVSIVLFCIETLPQFQEEDSSNGTNSQQIFFIIETICIAWFTFEYITRLLSSPHKWIFVKGPLNVIDLIAILPFFLAFALNNKGSNVSSMAILRAVRLVRVFRIFKLSRYSTGLQILGMTLRASLSELGLLVFFLSVGVVLFASAIYYAEMSADESNFYSIPHSFWWAIVTMTTVGYGDMYPTTLVGKMIGSVCACTGILAIALPVPVIVANFEKFYSKAIKEAQKTSDDKAEKKAAKYKALKRFFDKVRQRNNNNNSSNDNHHHISCDGDISDEYYDMAGLSARPEKKQKSGEDYQKSLLDEKKEIVCTSNV